MLPKGVLFDFDGVVVDSTESHFTAWASAYKELFNKTIPSFHPSYVGRSPREIAEYFCRVTGREELGEELFILKEKHLDFYFTKPVVLPGVHECTDYLSKQRIPYGIASNATRQFLKNSIEGLNLNFTNVLGLQDYKRPKPSPEAYISLAIKLGFEESDFENLWVFEDSIPGITAAKSAGMIPIGIQTQCTKGALKNAGSEAVFPTLLEACSYLKTLE